ncbi:MAG: sugar porter family MFS transporter [Phocaeicola sp.]
MSKNFSYTLFLSVVAALGGFLFGYDTAVISGTIDQVSTQFGLDALSKGWYVGCALVGSILGVSVAGVLSDKYGRKPSLLVAALLFSASALGCALCNNMSDLILYRLLGGVGVGVASIISPLYISEIAIPKHRGMLVSLYQLAVTVGFLAAYLVNYQLLGYSVGSFVSSGGLFDLVFVNEVWRGMLGMEFLPALLFLIILVFIPESPRWLLLKGKDAKALVLMNRLGGDQQEALVEMNRLKQLFSGKKESEWHFLMRPSILKAVAIGAAIAILGQFMGVNAVLYYGPTIFSESGLSQGDSLFYQILVGLVNVLTTVLALFIIDRVGRKKLVYWGVSGMIAMLLLIGGYFQFGAAMGVPNGYLLFFFLTYVFCCAISICAVIFVLLSEMFPMKVRGVAMSIAGLSLWIGTYLIGQLTPWLLESITPAGTFLLFAAMSIPYILIIRFWVPETTGKSLEEIEKYWERGA